MWTSLNLLSRIYLYALICICNQPWEFLFYENLFESFLSVRISSYCVNLSESLFLWESFWIFFIRKNLFLLCESFWIFFYCENLFKPFLFVKIFSYLCSSVRTSFIKCAWNQFWNLFFEGAILKCLYVLKCIFWGSNYFTFFINGSWIVWLLLYVFY